MSELVVISLPGVEVTAAGALLRVLLVPRLTGPGTSLGDYGLTDWPAALANATTMQVTVRTSAGQDLKPEDVIVRHTASSDVWRAFFDGITVKPFAGVATYAESEVAPTASHADQIDSAYAVATQSVGDPHQVEQQLDGLALAPPPPTPDPSAPIPTAEDPEFHQFVSRLRQHPFVLRHLGLIVDVTVPRGLIDQAGGGGQITVRWAQPPVAFDQLTTPATAFVVRQNRFLAAPATETVDGATVAGFIVDGMVDLRRTTSTPVVDAVTGATSMRDVPDWAVQTVDIDAAVARLTDAQDAVRRTRARAQRNSAPVEAGEGVMPALRSMGLQLVHRQRDPWLRARHQRAAANRDAVPETLNAEDLVLGYRLDVRYAGGAWYSLMRRKSRYSINGLAIGGETMFVEEGHASAAAGVKGTTETVYSDGVVARWKGLRLAVHTPPPDGRPAHAVTVATDRDQPLFAWKHEIDDTEPAGLPELRFSKSYQLRLRVVDFAGGGLDVDDVVGDTAASKVRTYARHEPVLPPSMPSPPGLLTVADTDGAGLRARVHDDLLGPGGALDRLVIRSDPAGTTPDVTGYPDNHTRTLLPPPLNFELAEWEDLLSGADPATAINARRARALPRGTADERGGRHYTWLPDIAAQSVSVTVAPVAKRIPPTEPGLQNWGAGTWPDHAPKQVHVVPGTGTRPTMNWVSDTSAEVALPPACRAVVDVSSAVDSTYFGRFAAQRWAPEGSPAQDAVVNGRHPVVTPALRVEVVHAVRAPLQAPQASLQALRDEGDTSARLEDPAQPRLGIDRDSTAQVDVVASWQEWFDSPEPSPVTQSVRSFPVDLDAEALPPLVHEFGDTKHRHITYTVAARSRFREFFAADDPEAAFVRATELDAVHVPSTLRPVAPVVVSVVPAFRVQPDLGGSVLSLPPFAAIDDIDGDGTSDDVQWPPPGALVALHSRKGGVLRVELGAPWYSTGEDEQLGVVVSPGGVADLPVERNGFDPTKPMGDVASFDNAHADLVTRAYRDPVLAVPAPVQPTLASLGGLAGSPLIVQDHETRIPICVAPVPVFQADGRWFADVDLGTLGDQATSTFIRLSLVRFQRHSLARLTTSPIVTTDLVAVLPSRELRVELRSGSVVAAELTGLGTGGPVELRLEAAPPGTPLGGLSALGSDGPGWAVLQRLQGTLNGGFAQFTLPTDGRAVRIVVREFDPIPAREPAPVDVLDQQVTGLPQYIAVVGVAWF